MIEPLLLINFTNFDHIDGLNATKHFSLISLLFIICTHLLTCLKLTVLFLDSIKT